MARANRISPSRFGSHIQPSFQLLLSCEILVIPNIGKILTQFISTFFLFLFDTSVFYHVSLIDKAEQ